MAEKSTPPVVIKKVVKGGGHHGGSWKVAYADFVTAMMAFFLLMWLLATANQQQKAAISEYFKNPSAEIGASPTPSPGAVQGPITRMGTQIAFLEAKLFDLKGKLCARATSSASLSDMAFEKVG